MKSIHLIQNSPDIRPWPVTIGSTCYESGYWALTTARAESLVGANIYFHEKQVGASFFGGVIESFRTHDEEPWKGRIIFTFTASRDHKGMKTDRAGWSMKMKIVD